MEVSRTPSSYLPTRRLRVMALSLLLLLCALPASPQLPLAPKEETGFPPGPEWDLAVVMSTNVLEANEGDLVVYAYDMSNYGQTAFYVCMSGLLEGDELTYVSDNSSTLPGSYRPGLNEWTLNPGFPYGATYRLEVTVSVNPGTSGTVIDRDAWIRSYDDWGHDTNYFNNRDYHQLVVRSIWIETATNGFDADSPSGPMIPVGEPVEWTYEIVNVSGEALHSVSVVDDQGVVVHCPESSLGVGESMTCTASSTAVVGQYANDATASGFLPSGDLVSDSDPSHYLGLDARVSIETRTNGSDADDPPGPSLALGAPVSWTYEVTNTGQETLTGLDVVDDQGVIVSCPSSTLLGGESMICTATGTAMLGQYTNLGAASGQPSVGGPLVTADDPSHYFVPHVQMTATKDDQLLEDLDGDGAVDPGDVLSYTIVVTNPLDALGFEAVDLSFNDSLDSWSLLDSGSVTTSHGMVISGNGAGDTAVEVALGNLVEGESATIAFSARVDPNLPTTVLSLVNQGSIVGANVLPTSTEDPESGGPTVTHIASRSLAEIPAAGGFGLGALVVLLCAAAWWILRRPTHTRGLSG